MAPDHRGLRELFTYPLMSAIFDRRTRRVARGTSIPSGPISYTSPNKPAPLTPLEEAVLIVSTGLTGSVTMHDVPAKNDDGSERFSAPLINILARSASSIDNAHAVSFFLINDEGTWLIKQHRNQEALALLSQLPPRWEDWTEADWLAAAASVKHRLYKERLDFPRHWPYYFIWNRQLSNRPGHDDSSADRRSHAAVHQRHHQPAVRGGWPAAAVHRRLERFRPRTLLDWGAWFASLVGLVPKISYQIIGGARRARGNWLNTEYPAPIGFANTLRTDYETFFQLQNLMLIAQAHGTRRVDPRGGRLSVRIRAGSVQGQVRHRIPDAEAEEVAAVAAASDDARQSDRHRRRARVVDAALRQVDGRGGGPGHRGEVRTGGHLRRQHHLRPRLQEERIRRAFLKMANQRPTPEAVEYTKEICNYICDTYGRFPAHVNAFHLPGVWLQFSHLELEFYDKYFDADLYRRQAAHHEMWGDH